MKKVDTSIKKKIIDAHRVSIEKGQEAVIAAIKCGEYLYEAKDKLEHGNWVDFIQKQLPFSTRTAQNYMKLFKNQAEISMSGIEKLSDAYSVLATPKKPVSEKIKKVTPQKVEDAEVVEDGEDPIILDRVETKKAYDSTQFWYWREFQTAASALHAAYRSLSKKRTHTTPKSLAMMIGNLEMMAFRIEMWNPGELELCPECDGTGQLNTNGKGVTCKHCIDGKSASYVETDI